MKNKVEIDGKWYELVPLEDKIEEENVTFYYACDSDCGFFNFNILLNDDGYMWKGTESVTYYPKGYNKKDSSEIWDNVDFLNDVLDNPTAYHVKEVKELIKNNGGEFEDLIHLLEQEDE